MHHCDSVSPRHARMFELLRQSLVAETTVGRVNSGAIGALDRRCALEFQALALNSLKYTLGQPKLSDFNRQ